MNSWKFYLTETAEEDLKRISYLDKKRILTKIKWLKENFEKITPMPLHGVWQGFFKFRIGIWRVIYEIEYNRKIIIIHYIGKRDTIYKKR